MHKMLSLIKSIALILDTSENYIITSGSTLCNYVNFLWYLKKCNASTLFNNLHLVNGVTVPLEKK